MREQCRRLKRVAPLELVQALGGLRAAREPLAYVLGEWGFRRLLLKTDPRALVPRPETEIVVERCLALLEVPSAPTRPRPPARHRPRARGNVCAPCARSSRGSRRPAMRSRARGGAPAGDRRVCRRTAGWTRRAPSLPMQPRRRHVVARLRARAVARSRKRARARRPRHRRRRRARRDARPSARVRSRPSRRRCRAGAECRSPRAARGSARRRSPSRAAARAPAGRSSAGGGGTPTRRGRRRGAHAPPAPGRAGDVREQELGVDSRRVDSGRRKRALGGLERVAELQPESARRRSSALSASVKSSSSPSRILSSWCTVNLIRWSVIRFSGKL